MKPSSPYREMGPRPAAGQGRRALLLLILAAMLVCLPACGQAMLPLGTARTVQEQTVSLQVVKGPGGAVLALVPIFVNNQGPFAFALDTGASQSLVDKPIADQLNLPVIGQAGQVTGVTGAEEAMIVAVQQWRMGGVVLPPIPAISLNLPNPSEGPRIEGLLGSDILSRFGAITVDYEREQLVLRTRQ